MSDPILLFLTADGLALLVTGALAAVMPTAASGLAVLSGLGLLLALLSGGTITGLALPLGPPGLSPHLGLDGLSAFFLAIVFLAGTAIAAYLATLSRPQAVRMTALSLGGTVFVLLAADGVSLAIGLAVSGAALGLPNAKHRIHLAVPLLLLLAVCLLTPAGFAPRFDTIRASPVDPDRGLAASALTIGAFALLLWDRSRHRTWTHDALTAGVLVPAALYLLLRLIADLPGPAVPNACGFAMLLAGAAFAIVEAWRGAGDQQLDVSVACLARRQAWLGMAGVGLALIARTADLPAAAALALSSSILAVIASGIAGVAASLATHQIAAQAGTVRLSRLGGLVHAMPATSAALSAGLLALSAIPPATGFASLWLTFQAILLAPRTGGLLAQLPLALTAAALALSAALTSAACLRLIGVAVLGRARTPQGAGAQESRSPVRAIPLVMAALSVLPGLLPGPLLAAVAGPAILGLTGAPPAALSAAAPGYTALPVVAMLVFATAGVMLAARRFRRPGRIAGYWADGMPPPDRLPFGDPAAQSVGEGFLPALPAIPVAAPTGRPALPALPVPAASAGLWALLAAFGLLLLVLAVAQ